MRFPVRLKEARQASDSKTKLCYYSGNYKNVKNNNKNVLSK